MGSRREPTTRVVDELTALIEKIASMDAPANPRERNTLIDNIRRQTDHLERIADQLDPYLRPAALFDPSDPQTSGRIIALTMVAQARYPIAALRPFYGAGIYAIYYHGDFGPYAALSGSEQPLYVGKADPKLPAAKDATTQGPSLYLHLNEHAKNIARATTTLDVTDFECRFLIVQSGYQRSAEQYLIDYFKPIWNSETGICYGLGKHGDSAVTRANKRSPWDTLHPGRAWATGQLEDQKPANQIIDDIAAHLAANIPPATIEDIFSDFMADLLQLAPADFRTATDQTAAVDAATSSDDGPSTSDDPSLF